MTILHYVLVLAFIVLKEQHPASAFGPTKFLTSTHHHHHANKAYFSSAQKVKEQQEQQKWRSSTRSFAKQQNIALYNQKSTSSPASNEEYHDDDDDDNNDNDQSSPSPPTPPNPNNTTTITSTTVSGGHAQTFTNIPIKEIQTFLSKCQIPFQPSMVYSPDLDEKLVDIDNRKSIFRSIRDDVFFDLIDTSIVQNILNKDDDDAADADAGEGRKFEYFLRRDDITHIKYEHGDYFKVHRD